MCQVSSALYDAVLYAELEVTERHNHSMKVGYSPYAFDATLAGDYKDFKFKNNTNKAVYIESYLTSSNVVVNLYGEEIHPAGRTIEQAYWRNWPWWTCRKERPYSFRGRNRSCNSFKGL